MGSPHFTNWLAFVKGRELATSIFRLSRTFPKEERYALTDQVMRSSHSVCANLAESFAKRRYPKHFIAKLTDAEGENYETLTWLLFARDHGYVSAAHFQRYQHTCEEIARLISYMKRYPEKFLGTPTN